jgi:group II intron reverse transcriptase/maturase
MVWQAWLQIRSNGKAAGVDGKSLGEFESNLKDNLYRLWNRLASGSYFPPAVKRVEIPKGDGGVRPLGIPTVADRVAQMVIKQYLEPLIDPCFDEDSYGYRPGKSAHQALERTRKRCWQSNWVLDLDIKGFFDSIDHDLLLKALGRHTADKWVLMYVTRWLKAPVQMPDGQLVPTLRGTPQGGVVSPLLANLFLHYAFDKWMRKHYPGVMFERYADDAVCHCVSEQLAHELKQALELRFDQCGLKLHPDKTKVVYCKDSRRKGSYPQIKFDFLGYCFRPRLATDPTGQHFTSFIPAVSPKSMLKMRERIRSLRLGDHALLSVEDVTRFINPILKGWWQYYGRFYKSAMFKLFKYLDECLAIYLRRKYRNLFGHKGQSLRKLNEIAKTHPSWLIHWGLYGRAMVG